jgi:predicted nucleic acid-binding protein
MGSPKLKALLDTNILVEYGYGVEKAVEELERYEKAAVSRIVWLEFLIGAKTAEVIARRRTVLENFELIEIDEAVCEETILVRQRTRLKLPDAVVLATARVHGLLLVTRNYRDFSSGDPNIRIPY